MKKLSLSSHLKFPGDALVGAATFANQVTSSGKLEFTRVSTSDEDDIDLNFLISYFGQHLAVVFMTNVSWQQTHCDKA